MQTPWTHGTFLRATRYPHYYDYNLVRIENDPAMGVDELTAIADQALCDLEHRRFDFELAEAGDAVRAEFEAAGWEATRLLWMRHEGPDAAGDAPSVGVDSVSWDAVLPLRRAWHYEDFPDVELGDFLSHAREVAMLREVEVLAVTENDEPIAFSQLERSGPSAEITHVYVHSDHRGRGLGTAITRAAIDAAGDVEDLWIVADDDARAKEIYARLGFRAAWTSVEFLRIL